MHRFIERFERFARANVVLVYLSAMFIATATYFAGRSLGLGGDLLWYVAIAEALAVELHSFLSQRLTRDLHEQRHAHNVAMLSYADRDALDRRYTLHFRITCALVAFSVFNSVGFWATQMQPATLGDWCAVVLRGAVVPLFFLAAGFLVPLHEDTSAALQDAGAELVRTMMSHAIRQWRKRVSRARRRGANLAEPLAALLELQEGGEDVPLAMRIRIMDSAITAAEGGSSARPSVPLPAPITPTPTRPPTGGGTPQSGGASKRKKPGRKREAAIALVAPRYTAEERIRAIVAERPGISVRALAKRAKVSESTASKWLGILAAEDAGQVAK